MHVSQELLLTEFLGHSGEIPTISFMNLPVWNSLVLVNWRLYNFNVAFSQSILLGIVRYTSMRTLSRNDNYVCLLKKVLSGNTQLTST